MKLLLTSAGIENKSIAQALIRLVGKCPHEVKIGFIPTAANVEKGNKDWFINQLTQLQNFGFTWIDVVDISASGVDFKHRLEHVDVIYVSGGNTFHLLDQVRKNGFDVWLEQVLATKVYVGASAGSILATPSIAIASIDDGDENLLNLIDLTALALVDFEVSPHMSTHVSVEANDSYAKTISNMLYAIDDNTAIAVDGDVIEIISEGQWRKY